MAAGRAPVTEQATIEPPEWVPETPTDELSIPQGSDGAQEPEPPSAAATGAALAPEPAPETEALASHAAEVPEGKVSVLRASFDDLRELGMSVTQAKRVIRHRDDHGITSIDELDQIPGFPKAFLAGIKERLVP